jgi:hypothetical protein
MGWRVIIADADGKEFDPAGFEKLMEQTYSTLFQAIHLRAQGAQRPNDPAEQKPRSGFFAFKKLRFLWMNQDHRSGPS